MSKKSLSNFSLKISSALKLSLTVLICFLSFSSCKTSKKSTSSQQHTRLDYKSPRTLVDLMKKSEFKADWVSTKFTCDAEVDGKSNSFTVNLRSRKDSVIWMSISALGIEAARVIITKDSVKLRNSIKKNYFLGDYNYLSKLLNTDVDFQMVQSLLVGNSFEFYEEEDEKLRAAKDDRQYILSTVRKRKLKRVLGKNEGLKELVQIIWLEPVNFKISRILVNDFNTNRTFDAVYSNFQQVDSLVSMPYNAKFFISAEKKLNIDISYSKVTINTPQAFPFSIPESYERKQ